ncbi:MAG: STAS domain-containing protein [Planctomycetota bacterium]
MDLVLETGAKVSTLKMVGNIGLADVSRLTDTLEGIVRTAEIRQLLVDCTALDNWDDAAISGVVNFIREMTREADRRVALFGLSATLKAGLDRLGIGEILASAESRDAALDALSDANDD